MNSKKELEMCFFLGVAGIFLDRTTKNNIKESMEIYDSYPIIKNILYKTYVENDGAAFSVLSGKTIFLVVLPVFIIMAIAVYLYLTREKNIFMERIGLTCIAAGGIGNLIDRILYGSVVDFIDFRIWPIFNIADIMVCIGCVIFCISILYESRKITK